MKKNNKAVVANVEQGSIAQEAQIEPGDILLTINRKKVNDILDYKFLVTDSLLKMEIKKSSGEIWEVEIEKDEYEDLGIQFEDYMLFQTRSCQNKCIFCFIDQLPQGLRSTLYFKDDDSNLSFLTGSYVTLTNMDFEDMQKIIEYKMSPINISVHTTNPDLRKFMLNNKFAGNVLDKIKLLVNAGIIVNCQIVLCRGINDGKELDKSILDIASLYPGVRSLSVVPVGLTKYRENLFRLKPYDKHSSKQIIKQVAGWQDELLQRYGSRIVFLADEFYIMASQELPEYEQYEGFPQIENGVGLVRLLMHEFYNYMKEIDYMKPDSVLRKISIATGVLVKPYIEKLVDILQKKFNNLDISIFEIKNDFFGENVTVTGLLTGKDLISQLEGKDLGQELLLSSSMIKAGEDVFLDDISIKDVEKHLKVKVTVVTNTGKDFICKVLGLDS